MIAEDFPLVAPGERYLAPEGVPSDSVGFVRFHDSRGMLRGVGFGPNVDVQLMAEQISDHLGVRVEFRLPGRLCFYSLPGSARCVRGHLLHPVPPP